MEKIPQLEKALQFIAEEIDLSYSSLYLWDYSEGKVKAIRELPLRTIQLIENNLKYEIHLGEDNHTGLFLDQRDNRKLIQSVSQDKKVLNLFCYTGSFSVAALVGGASEIVSVDLSKKTLEWVKRNMDLNSGAAKTRYFAEDALLYLNRLERKQETFDIIICDPPTFSRSKKGIFSTEKNLEDLLESCLKILSSTGKLLFSLNTQKITLKEFSSRVKSVCKSYPIVQLTFLDPPFDFPKHKGEPHLKAVWIEK